MPRAVSVFQFLFSLLRFRAARAVLWFLASLWLFDRLVYFITETQWFASVGMSGLWLARCRAQAEMFLGVGLTCLLLTRLFLGTITKIVPAEAPPLRGKLAGAEPLRARVSRLAWGLAFLFALLTARNFARGWSDWLFLCGAPHSGTSFVGLPIELWTHYLPVLSPFLYALWAFSWLLFGIVAATGVLRALPELAARQPAPPLALTRTLWLLGAWLLGLRALLYGVQFLDLARGKAIQTGDLYVSTPLFVLGGVACVVWGVVALRRAKGATSRQKFSQLALAMLAAVWLPGLLNWLAAPERALLPETAWLQRLRQNATQTAWQLDFTTPLNVVRAAAPEVAWPLWDEKSLLQALRGASFQNNRVVTWQSASLHFESEKWHALAVGQGVGSTAWTARRDADENTQLEIKRIDFSPQNGAIEWTPLANERAFFGFEGRSLFSEDDIGVPMESMGRKWLWAWRLRDLFLPFDGAGDSHLLVYRGALERAQKVAPFWKVSGEPRLVLRGQTPFWMLDLCATSSNYPGAMSAPSGDLLGVNAASDGLKMLLDARSGEVSFYAASDPPRNFPLDAWRAALRGILKNGARLPEALRREWRGTPALLETQLALLNEVRLARNAAEKSRVLPSFLTVEAGRGVVLRAIAESKNSLELFDSPSGGFQGRILQRARFDLNARRAAIDAALAKNWRSDAPFPVASEPVVWRDARAPGGFWIGRAFFSRTTVEGQEKTSWRVALTGAGSGNRVGIGESVRAAHLDLLGQSQAAGKMEALELQALRTHSAELAAAKRGDWNAFSRESRRTQKILEQMVAR